ncbi:MAG: phasin family protein [Rhodospirillales bacterium]|jgi:hypothetical protein|nr:phasin family protein [Rhodospirillales bacterium]
MAEAHSKTRRSPEGHDTPSNLVNLAGAAPIDPFLQAGNRLLEGWVALSSELLEFGRTRLDHGLQISKALAQTASLNEAIDLQSQYARMAVQDYVAEANKIADLGTRSLLDSMSQLRPAAEQAAKHVEAAD